MFFKSSPTHIEDVYKFLGDLNQNWDVFRKINQNLRLIISLNPHISLVHNHILILNPILIFVIALEILYNKLSIVFNIFKFYWLIEYFCTIDAILNTDAIFNFEQNLLDNRICLISNKIENEKSTLFCRKWEYLQNQLNGIFYS
jgi:hypothetical protein